LTVQRQQDAELEEKRVKEIEELKAQKKQFADLYDAEVKKNILVA
jgi:hypothetical protein